MLFDFFPTLCWQNYEKMTSEDVNLIYPVETDLSSNIPMPVKKVKQEKQMSIADFSYNKAGIQAMNYQI